MRTITPRQRALAWALIAALAHPSIPAQAQVPPNGVGDFTLYTSSSSSGASQPNILLIVDTSDSMNIAEAWREYPGDYDSHVEYLWNDLNRIVDADAGSGGEATVEHSERISTGVTSAAPYSKWGFWGGDTLTARQALWQAARAYAKGTQAGDPGPRSTYRNYDDLSWFYWLPAGTAETDARLRSPSWNRFRGHVQAVGGKRGNIVWGHQKLDGSGNPMFDSLGHPIYENDNDYQAYNQCGSSFADITPSTVFAPSSAPLNSGKFVNQQWARWEPWANLDVVGNAGYPGSSVAYYALGGATAASPLYTRGYLDVATAPSGNPTNNLVYRDGYPGTSPFGATGLPIRVAGTSSGATWTELKADLGGFNFRSVIEGYGSAALLDDVKSWYGLAATTDVDSSGTSDIFDARYIAWKGNRDASPAFGMATGVPAYADATPAPCDAQTGPASATCLRRPGAAVASVQVTKTRACTLTGFNSETDVSNTTRHWGGTCSGQAVTCDDPNGPGNPPDCGDVPDPVCGSPSSGFPNYPFVLSRAGNCDWNGRSNVTYEACTLQNVTSVNVPTCMLQGASSVSVPICTMAQTPVSVGACTLQGQSSIGVAACAPTGGSTVTVDACTAVPAGSVTVGTCAPADGATVSIAACAFVGRQTATVGTCQWHDRETDHVEGVGWYAWGGSCSESGSTANCTASGATWGWKQWINNNGGAFFNRRSDAANDPRGCTNIVPAGTVYNYGGSCRENGDWRSCQVTGGIDATIAGTLYHNVNGVCGNKPSTPAGTYTFGAVCKESGSTASCNTSAGTTMTIRGMDYAGVGATCSNKVAAGVYNYGVVCREHGVTDSCSTSAGTSLTIRGVSYTGIGATCSNTVAAGTYAYGVTCKESGSAANCLTNAGTSRTIRGTAYEVGQTCSNTVAPGTYKIGGVCQENGSAASCGTSTGTSMVIGGVAQTGVNRTCTQLTPAGTYLVGGTCNPGVPTCAFNPGSTINIRGTEYPNYGASCTNAAGYAAGTYSIEGSGCGTSDGTFLANCAYNPGETKIINGVERQHVGASCSNISGAGTLYYGGDSCAGTPGNCTYNAGTTWTIGGTPFAHVGAACSNIVPPGSYPVGGSCVGNLWTAAATATPGGNYTNNFIVNTADACSVVGDSCVNKPDTSTTCSGRYGTGCESACGPASSSVTTGGGFAPDQYFRVYNFASSRDYLVHECKADEPARNPGGNSYMRGTIPLRTLGTDYNAVTLTDDPTAAYTTNSGQAVAADAGKRADIYSVNYLNWKFGPKGPNGHPIGRKTRLQIAKDALSGLVANTNGVRFGMMVFNKTANDFSNEGGNIAYKVTDMGPKNCSLANASTTGSIDAGSSILTLASNPGFGIGNPITIPGAGAGGATLSATITAIDANVLGLSAAASTTVASATITVPACNDEERASYNNRVYLTNTINGLTAASRTPLTESLYEAYLYFRGAPPLFGRSTTEAYVGGTVSAGYDASAFDGSGNYVSPMMSSINPNTGAPASCSKNFVIMMTDGGPEEDFSANAQIKALTWNDGTNDITPVQATSSTQLESGGTPLGPIDPTGADYDGGYVWLDELAYYMAHADVNDAIADQQPVSTFTIGFAGADSPVLSNAAAKGNGTYFVAQNAAELANALASSVSAIKKWNSTFAGPGVPTAAINRSESSRDVYLAFFGPSSNQAWDGTLKKFRLGTGTECREGAPVEEICIIGKSALSGTAKNINLVNADGATINPAAMSFWNPSNVVDGASANRGGTGQNLLGGSATPATRKVYTFISDPGTTNEATSTSLNLDDTANLMNEGSSLVTKARLGNAAMTDAQRAALINTIRTGNMSVGACTDDPGAGTACTSWRGWPHYDIMHGTPAILTYDPTSTSDSETGQSAPSKQYLFYLSNDGLMHAVNALDGKEAWAFLVEEALPQIHAIKDNFAGQHLTLADGEVTMWTYDKNGDAKIVGGDGDKAYVYFGLRRGGRSYYALDVTDIDHPKLLWKIQRGSGTHARLCNADHPDCVEEAGFDELGYTWSAPVPVRIPAITEAGTPAVIFGGGYDANQDNHTPTAADTMGRALYVVNGKNGSLLKAFKNGEAGAVGGGAISGMDFSIPANVAALNIDLDSRGRSDRVYVGDMAANLWRFDIDHPDVSHWTAKKLAALSDTYSLPATVPNRKIFTAPVVVKQNWEGKYDAVYVGTGDREHPLRPTSQDRMFMIKDADLGVTASAGSPIGPGNLYDVSDILFETDFDLATFKAKSGWYIKLPQGEKLFAKPSVLYNKLRYSTFNPGTAIGDCFPPGKGMVYLVDAHRGGLPPGVQVTAPADGNTFWQWRQNRSFVVGTGGTVLAGVPMGGGVLGPASTSPITILDGNVYVLNCGGGVCINELIGTVGGANKIYWYRETAR